MTTLNTCKYNCNHEVALRKHTKPITNVWKFVPADPQKSRLWVALMVECGSWVIHSGMRCYCKMLWGLCYCHWTNMHQLCVCFWFFMFCFWRYLLSHAWWNLWSNRRVILWHDVTWSFGILPVTSEVSTIKIDACCNFEGFHQKWEMRVRCWCSTFSFVAAGLPKGTVYNMPGKHRSSWIRFRLSFESTVGTILYTQRKKYYPSHVI